MISAALSIVGPDGQRHVLFAKGAKAPSTARVTFATQRAGERSLVFKLEEDEPGRLVGTFSAQLPPGLPANTWLAVAAEVSPDHSLRLTVRENLRRIQTVPAFDATGAGASVFTIKS